MIEELSIRNITDLAKQKIVPVSMLIEVCHTCNEKCVHCCLPEHNSNGLTLFQYEKLFDQMVEAGTLFVILTGGEPFMRSDFLDIVRSARNHYLSVTIFTNGTLLTKKIILELKKLFVQEVHISLYSADPEVHDKITKKTGSFQKSLRAIKRLAMAGITTRIKCPLMNKNADNIDCLKKLARELKADIQFTSIITSKNNGDNSTQSLRMTAIQAKKALTDNKIDKHSFLPTNFSDQPENCIPCDVVFNGGSIDPFGNVFVCNQLRICGGNILDKSLTEIWKNSPKFQKLRNIRLSDLWECVACDLFKYCTRCPGLALLEDGNLFLCSTAAKNNAILRKEIGVYPNQTHVFSERCK